MFQLEQIGGEGWTRMGTYGHYSALPKGACHAFDAKVEVLGFPAFGLQGNIEI